MAEIIWTEPALTDLDGIADCIALDKPDAARRLVQRVFRHVEHLATHPRSGTRLRELGGDRYRQILETPCRVIYRIAGSAVFIVHVMRAEKPLRVAKLRRPTTKRSGKR